MENKIHKLGYVLLIAGIVYTLGKVGQSDFEMENNLHNLSDLELYISCTIGMLVSIFGYGCTKVKLMNKNSIKLKNNKYKRVG